jgi:hypothetical protein
MANKSQTLQALQSFTCEVAGQRYDLRKGDLIEADHPIAEGWPDFFGPLVYRYPMDRPRVEQATAAPGEKRGA